MDSPRADKYKELFPQSPAFRWQQIGQALFNRDFDNWNDISSLPTEERQTLQEGVPWLSAAAVTVQTSRDSDTFKALLSTADHLRFESVLMANTRGSWTICVSSQIGCAMACTFCATGAMGLTRNLTADEIMDQYRFWQHFLKERPGLPQRISNIVFMGMGEPLANYANIKAAIKNWLQYTDLGPTRITVSSVGLLPILNRLLTDPDWPPVRIAISLHSANQQRRREIIPFSSANFIEELAAWAKKYRELRGNRRHHLTFEYTLINEVNDTPELAKELAAYARRFDDVKVNVIPLNAVVGKPYSPSQAKRIQAFKKILRTNGVDVTQRRTMGSDIAAACGQLAVAHK